MNIQTQLIVAKVKAFFSGLVAKLKALVASIKAHFVKAPAAVVAPAPAPVQPVEPVAPPVAVVPDPGIKPNPGNVFPGLGIVPPSNPVPAPEVPVAPPVPVVGQGLKALPEVNVIARGVTAAGSAYQFVAGQVYCFQVTDHPEKGGFLNFNGEGPFGFVGGGADFKVGVSQSIGDMSTAQSGSSGSNGVAIPATGYINCSCNLSGVAYAQATAV